MINILPDSGLPIEEEVKRNINNLIDSCRKEFESDNKNLSDEAIDCICDDAQCMFLEEFGPEIREQIKAIRGKEIC